MKINIHYGITSLENITVDPGSTVRDVAHKYNDMLGLPENFAVRLNDDEYVSVDEELSPGDSIEFEQKFSTKAFLVC